MYRCACIFFYVLVGVAGIVTEVLMVYEPLIIFSDCANIIKVCLVRLCPQFFSLFLFWIYTCMFYYNCNQKLSLIASSVEVEGFRHMVFHPLWGVTIQSTQPFMGGPYSVMAESGLCV